MNDFPICRGARMVQTLNFLHYCQARVYGKSAEALAHIFPRAQQFERMYQDKLKAMEAEHGR